jgi:Sulfotransferase family
MSRIHQRTVSIGSAIVEASIPGLVSQNTAGDVAAPQGKAPRAVTVIYIAGSGRSGSTLLERTLGEISGFVNVGELIDLFRRTVYQGERCGCGQNFCDCSFWAGVGKRASIGWDYESLTAVGELQGRVARQRHLPRLLATHLAGRRFRADVASYGASYARLYGAIADESGASYVVDASKWPVQALALARSGIDVRVIHLVRDIRGVAHSHSKNVLRPHAAGETNLMSHSSPAGAAARWVACQVEAELLRWCGGLKVTRIRYEDFVRQPEQTIRLALAQLGVSAEPSQLAHVGDGKVMLSQSHGLSGNPARFRDGRVTLRADNDWRHRMSRRDRIVVTAIGLPWLLRYGRPGPHTPPRAGTDA